MRRRLALTVALVAGASLAVAAPVHAVGDDDVVDDLLRDDRWFIESFDVAAEVTGDGDLLVTETLQVDFASLERRGILRDIPVRYDVPPDPWYDLDGREPDDLQRVIEIDDLEVSSDTAPDDLDVERPGPLGGEWLHLRIGDEDQTITGAHSYTISYRVRGALDQIDGQPELFWNATGNDWPVIIDRASVTMTGGDPIETACFVGGYGATETCDEAAIDADTARFGAERLMPGDGLSVAVQYAPGSLSVPPPLLLERWRLDRALWGNALAWPLAVLTALLGLGGVAWLAYRQGRDRVLRGGVTAAGALDSRRPEERRRGLIERRTVPVRYRPPEGLRPAQLGLIIDESVDPVDISATIVDLAVRGHLVIAETGGDGGRWGDETEWMLRRTRPAERSDVPPERSAFDALLPYEQQLLDALFADGDEVSGSDLKGEFFREYQQVERAIYADGQQRRWFAKRPDQVRSRWLGLGVAATVVAMGLLVVAVLFTTFALVAVPLVLAGLALMVAHRWMPHRTAHGSRLLEATLGFREFIETADADRLRYAEAQDLFVPYLPYAIVFGEAKRWAQAFADLGIDPIDELRGWYAGYGAFNVASFSAGMDRFSTSMSSSMASVSASGSGGAFSGGGFSGGGFGGGGGGSW